MHAVLYASMAWRLNSGRRVFGAAGGNNNIPVFAIIFKKKRGEIKGKVLYGVEFMAKSNFHESQLQSRTKCATNPSAIKLPLLECSQ